MIYKSLHTFYMERFHCTCCLERWKGRYLRLSRLSSKGGAFGALRCFLDFIGTQTARADFDSAGSSVCLNPHRLKIRIKNAFCLIVSVAYMVPGSRSLAANLTLSCHDYCSLNLNM